MKGRNMRRCALTALLALAFVVPAAAMETVSLDGLWDFRLEKGRSLEEVKMPDFRPDGKMPVPGCWDTLSRWYNQRGTGCYRRTFTLDGDAVNAFLVIDGCGLRSRYWMDGREIGFSKLPWSRFEFATGPLKAGRHELVCAVESIVDKEKVKLFSNFYDFYPFGGFHHGVSLVVQRRPVELRRIVVRTCDYRTGLVELEAQFEGAGAPADFTASVAFDEGAAYYYTARGNRPGWSNQVVAWSQLELVKYNVTNIMKDMKKPYCVITGENAWSRSASTEVFNAVPHDNKEMHVIPEASHFDMYDLEPFVSAAFGYILPFFGKNL